MTPDLIQRMKARAHALAAEPGRFYVDQFGPQDVRAGYEPMELALSADLNREFDVLVSAVGTGATLMGTNDGSLKAGARPKVVALEPLQSPLLTAGRVGVQRVEGIGVGLEPPFLDHAKVDDVRVIDQEMALDMCHQLANRAGVFCGGSTGLNIVATIELSREFGRGKCILTLSCDNGSKYLAGHIHS